MSYKLITILLFLMGYGLSNAQKCDFHITLDSYHSKEYQLQNGIFEREDMQFTEISKSGKFAVHYDITGFNAVSPIDNNNNNIPDYVDSTLYYIDMAYYAEVDTLGFEFDDYDKNAGGTAMYDIYIKELTNSPYYGGAKPEGSVITPENKIVYTSFIVIDNNFSAEDNKYNTTGIDGLKITLFHEFFHAIQFQITQSNYRVMGEMTATFMEYRFFPDIKDYIDWASVWFKSPTTISLSNSNDPSEGYGMSIFFQYTYETFGDGIMLDLWNGIGNNENDTESLNNVLTKLGQPLSESFCEFTEWMYRTGDNAIDGFGFKYAADLPNLELTTVSYFDGFEQNINEQLIPFTFSPQKLIVDKDNGDADTLVSFIVNTDLANGINNRYAIANGELTIAGKGVFINDLNNLDLSFKTGADTLFCYNFVESVGREYADAFPNPYRRSTHDELYLPVETNTDINDEVHFEIYSTNMQLQVEYSELPRIINNKLVVRVRDYVVQRLSPGVYIYKTDSGGKVKLGKFVVQ